MRLYVTFPQDALEEKKIGDFINKGKYLEDEQKEFDCSGVNDDGVS